MIRCPTRFSWLGAMAVLLGFTTVGHAQVADSGVASSHSGSARVGAPVGGARTVVNEAAYAGTSGLSPAYAAPGNYGTAYGYPSYGYPRTYTSFSSPYGNGIGYGVAPYGYASNRFGVGLWRPGYTVPGYAYRSSYYWTFAPAPIRPPVAAPFPPFGTYAPGYGPAGVYGW